MNELWAILYGLIQGITEFLPVSSSGHLALIPKISGIDDPGVVFDLVMHLGTALAIIIYYNKDIKALIDELCLIIKDKSLEKGHFFQNFIVATFCSFVFILLIKNSALAFGRSGTLIGVNLIAFGIIMFVSDLNIENKFSLVDNKSYKRSIFIGIFQSLAIFPGVSRSGITLTAARFTGLSRIEASRFSFLLSLPIIFASIIYKIPDILTGTAIIVNPINILIGIISSFIFGLLTIHFFVRIISKVGLGIFTVYRIVLGVLVFYTI